jgi:tetratricopeptide (TPR) repeat protein
MSRWVMVMLLAGILAGVGAGPGKIFADDLKNQRPASNTVTKEEVPKEEDESLSSTNKDYAFNPLQAEKEVIVGNYYFKKGSYRAAANRFREATRWNQGYGEAWLRLGEAAEKQKDSKTAKEAFAKYLEISPDAKDATEVRKKLAKIK